VLPGLEPIALEEVRSSVGAADCRIDGEGRLRVAGTVDRERLEQLRIVVSVGLVEAFRVARPKALLGDADLRRLAGSVGRATTGRRFTALRLAAAGADTPVMQRIGAELADRLGLSVDQEDGDLVVRIVRGADGGWEAITRTTPRPLGTRAWRVANMQGSVNATIAAAMVRLARPRRGELAVNLMGGAATIAIEHVLAARAARAVAFDLSAGALQAATENVAAAGVGDRVDLVRADVHANGTRPGRATLMYCDLPYGDKVSTQAGNDVLYPAALAEAARMAAPAARFVVITHDVRRFERCLRESGAWGIDDQLRVFQSGHRPGIWVLRSRG
jgi:tRNA (guanine6-N2)-methyltransferase